MKQILIIITMLFVITFGFSQEKMITKSGSIVFEASVPAFEEVKASNNNVTFVLNPITGEIACLALMKGFRFKVALMEEHFNENYVESDKYPKATFKGKIDGFDLKTLTTADKEYTINGKLEMHGKKKDIIVVAKIRKATAGIGISSNFTVNASEFDVDIPSIVKNKVSNKINVKLESVVK